MRTRRSLSSSDPVSEGHRTVLLHEAVAALDIQPNDVVVDATLGGGGHAEKIISMLDETGVLIGFDLDADALERTSARLKQSHATVRLIEQNFRHLKQSLTEHGISRITKALFDLGWSSYQLNSGRGFSFQADEPLLMTYTKEPGALTAATIVNTWEEHSIADVIFGWGEEHYARRIARAIALRRQTKPFTTAYELAEVIREAVPAAYRRGRLHPATKTFQALRIAVNDELGALKAGLESARELLQSKGRIAVITFHSIEDRLVKQTFVAWERQDLGTRVTKKPIAPEREEVQQNPRARSAKLRVFEKI